MVIKLQLQVTSFAASQGRSQEELGDRQHRVVQLQGLTEVTCFFATAFLDSTIQSVLKHGPSFLTNLAQKLLIWPHIYTPPEATSPYM